MSGVWNTLTRERSEHQRVSVAGSVPRFRWTPGPGTPFLNSITALTMVALTLRPATIVMCLLVLLTAGARAASASEKKAVQMLTTRQLKEVLAELKIPYKSDASRDDLKAIVLKHDGIQRWYELHPEKRKKRAGSGGRGGGGGGGGGDDDDDDDEEERNAGGTDVNDAVDFMMQHDKNGDRKLSRAEYSGIGHGDLDASFAAMDTNDDKLISRKEVASFINMVKEREEL